LLYTFIMQWSLRLTIIMQKQYFLISLEQKFQFDFSSIIGLLNKIQHSLFLAFKQA